MNEAAKKAAIKLIRAQDIELIKDLYWATAFNRDCPEFGRQAYNDYKDYAWYRWMYRGELEYTPVVHDYDEAELDDILISNMYGPGASRGFRQYVECVWDRLEAYENSWRNQNKMNCIRWNSRGE